MYVKCKTFARAMAVAAVVACPAVASGDEGATGSWSEHVNFITERGVSVVQSDAGGNMIVLETVPSPDSAVNVHVVLGKDGVADPGADLGKLRDMRGLQVFKAPNTMDMSRFNEIYLWNADRNAAIGVVPIR